MEAGIIEMIFSFGVVLALAFWQLWTVWDPTKKESDSTPDQDSESAPINPEESAHDERR